MAKMFYTLDEAASKLGVTAAQVREMATSGQIQEFRDRDKLMFKVEQIDLLAGGGDYETENIEAELSGFDASGSAIGLVDSREDTGISVFDTEHGEGDAGDTQITEALEDELSLESVGSGSGLLDLTRESDDTSLGAELIEEVYSQDDNVDVPAHASGLFEAAGAESPGGVVGAPVTVGPVLIEAYDGSGSGLGVGVMLGALVALVMVGIIITVTIMGGASQLANMMADNVLVWAGGLLVATLIFGGIGMFIGKASE